MKPHQSDRTSAATSSPNTSSSSSSAATASPFRDLRHTSHSSSSSSASSSSTASSTFEEHSGALRDGGQDTVTVERRGEHAAVCRWTVTGFPRLKARALWSRYFDVGGYDCRLLVYPKGDAQALPGYLSVYLQIMDPRGSSSSSGSSNRWDCFASYRLSIVNFADEAKTVNRDSWHRFSSKKKSHGWCDFTPVASVLDSKSGFLATQGDAILVTADILILDESVSFSRGDGGEPQIPVVSTGDVLIGKFTWRVRNFNLFRDMIKTQKIMSPVFPAGECNLRISIYQSSVGGVEHLSMCLESKDADKTNSTERSCWCLFRMSVLSQRPAGTSANHVHRDSYGRFSADNKGGDNTSLGWNDYMQMSDFLSPDSGYLVDDTAVFSVSFHVIKESSVFSKNVGAMVGGRGSSGMGGGQRKSDGHFGKFTWRIENFTKLKDLLKKRKITGLCVKSRRFQVGNRDCRLIVYPRGQSQPPCHLSVFLEVTDSRNTSNDWSCFVSHRLSVVNQKMEEKSVAKESQNRYSKSAKDWGWREFVTLTSLFDLDSGFLVQDTVVFSAEVLILKETSIMQDLTGHVPESSSSGSASQIEAAVEKGSFTWRVENFLSFKEIMETRKIFSKFFQAGGCELRIGVYESFDTICIYLESDQSAGTDPEKNFWVRYRMAVVNQKNSSKTVWKESSICTKTWNNSVLQFMKVSDMLEVDGGFLVRDTVVFVCEILDCCPWFDFSDLEVLASEDEQDVLSTDPEDINSDDTEVISGDEEDMLRRLLSTAGFHLTYDGNLSQPQVKLREKLLMDAGTIAGFLSGLRVFLDDPAKVKRLLLPTKLSGSNLAKKDVAKNDTSSPSVMALLMGVKVLQQAIIDLLLDIMVECCQPLEGVGHVETDMTSKNSPDANRSITLSDSGLDGEKLESVQCSFHQRLDAVIDDTSTFYAVHSSDHNANDMGTKNNMHGISPPETSATGLSLGDGITQSSKNKLPEQSEELLGLIVNSLRALDSAVPQSCPEPRGSPHSVQKIAILLDKAPKHVQIDLIILVPKVVDHSEHSLAACALLDHLQKPDAEHALRLPVFSALSQLEVSKEVREHILVQSFEILADSNDESLVEAIGFVFKTASLCQHLPQAARAVRSRLKRLAMDVPQCVLDGLSKMVITCGDVAEAILRDIDSDCEDQICSTSTCGPFPCSSHGISVVEEQAIHGCHHISDAYILVELLSHPGLFGEVSRVFERAISRGSINVQLLAMILDRRHSQRLGSKSSTMVNQDKHCLDRKSELLTVLEDDFNSVVSLGEVLSLSIDPQVQDFVRMLYAIMFKIYSDEQYRLQMLKGLVDRVTGSSNSCRLVDIDMDVLTFLVREEDVVARPVLNMMREACELAHVDRTALWHQVCANEEETIHFQEEKKELTSNFSREKAALSQKLNESEIAVNRLKSEMKSEVERFAREKKELSKAILEVENQLEWVRSERDEEIVKLVVDKKVLHDRLHDVETQLSQLKSRKREELKRVVKEKNALAERLKNAEAARKRFDEELKRFATETVTREEVRQSLEDEVRRLTQTVGQTEGEKREKEEQVARCEAYIDGIEAKLQTCQHYIHTLEASLQEEMSRHAPLYGAGLEALSMQELETLSRIHEEGLMQIRALQQRKGGVNNSLVSGRSLPHSMFATAQPITTGLQPSVIPNGTAVHGNGHISSSTGPWFSPT